MSGLSAPPFETRTLGKRAQRLRQQKKLSIEALAKRAGVNKNTVVRFEKGISTRLETIYKICHVLDVSPLELVEGKLIDGRDYAIQKHQKNKSTDTKKIKRKDRRPVEIWHGIDVGDLNYQLPDGLLNARVLEIQNAGELHTHPGEEFLFCLTGTIGVMISDVEAVLEKGDAVFFWGTEPHRYFNADQSKSVSVGLSVICGKGETA